MGVSSVNYLLKMTRNSSNLKIFKSQAITWKNNKKNVYLLRRSFYTFPSLNLYMFFNSAKSTLYGISQAVTFYTVLSPLVVYLFFLEWEKKIKGKNIVVIRGGDKRDSVILKASLKHALILLKIDNIYSSIALKMSRHFGIVTIH